LFLPASLAIGLGAVAVQVLVPYAANLAPDAVRGRVVGNVLSGLMLGIMLARPAAGLITDLLSWHAVFFTSAVLMVALAVGLRAVLPARWPEGGVSYGSLLMSMAGLARHTPILRRRAAYQAGLFSAYSVFWTTVPLLLADRFQLSQSGIALFAIAGVAGTIAAPIAGRVADRGWSRPATLAALLVGASAFLIGLAGHSITVLVIAANLLDFGVAANLVLGQRAIFSLGANMRSRLNALYMAMFFGAGGLGSAVGAWAYAQGGWTLSSWIGFGLPIAAALVWVSER
jgi:predicted MFS family arabinose efflux permease